MGSTDWKFYPLNTIIFLWALQEARDKKIRQRKDPMGEVANPPIWLRIKILHCTRVMLNHSGHMITHDDKTRPSNLVFLPNMGGARGCGGECAYCGTHKASQWPDPWILLRTTNISHLHPVIVNTASNFFLKSFRFRDPTKNPSEHFSFFITQSCQYLKRKMVLPTTEVTSVH